MADTDLLKMAAQAVGYQITWENEAVLPDGSSIRWSPLTDDGDALRLAVRLDIHIGPNPGKERVIAYTAAHIAEEPHGDDKHAATRRAIVRAAAEIGKGA